MSDRALPIGKLPVNLLRELLASGPPRSADLLVPPAVGEDAAAISIKGGALIAATDPITLTSRGIGRHAVVINANDVAVMGVRPRWFLAVLLLPPGVTEDDARTLFDDINRQLDRVGAVLVGGHTEVTPAVRQTVVIGQMLGFEENGRFVRTGGMQAGDRVLQIGPAPIEGAAVLAAEAAGRLKGLAPELIARARNALDDPGISVVGQALRAAELGATALHDPTEGGLSAGLYELAEASGLTLHVNAAAALWFAPGEAICTRLNADPWGVLASGTLLAAFPPTLVDQARTDLASRGFQVAELACAEPGSGVYATDGRPLPRHEQDELSRILGSC